MQRPKIGSVVVSNSSLLQNGDDVKHSVDFTIDNSRTSDLDNKYLNAVANNDLYTAQKLVDDVMKFRRESSAKEKERAKVAVIRK